MRTNRDKIAQVYRIYWLPVSQAEIENYPGDRYIYVSGDWFPIPFTPVEFKEEQAGGGKLVTQEMSCTITGLNEEFEERILKMISEYGLLRLDFTNEEVRVVGTEQVPVKLSLERGRFPTTYTLSFKRSSPEFSKILKSF